MSMIRDSLTALEQRLHELVQSRIEFIALIGEDLVAAGGKRVRPQLVFLTNRALGHTPAHEVDFAACIELLHSASLLHDDLIDDAETRRGKDAAFRRYGNVVSVFAGDFLLSKLMSVLAHLPNPAAFVELIADTSRQLCEGEVLQFQVAAFEAYSRETYLEVITGKTAVLTAAATKGAALLCNANPETVLACETFGLEYGRAFQIQDDLLDLMGEEAVIGKPIGGDLREGKATLPVLCLLEQGIEEAREILQRRAAQVGDVARMRELVHQHGAFQEAKHELRHRTDLALRALAALPVSPARKALEDLVLHQADRVA